MFTNCKKLKQIYPLTHLFFENLILHQPINFTGFDKNQDMFAGCNNLICDNTHKYVKKEDYVLIPHLFDSLGIEFGIWYKYFNSDKNILPLGYNAEHDLDTLEHRFKRAFL